LQQVGGFLRVLWFPPQIKNWLPRYNWNMLKVVLSTKTLTPIRFSRGCISLGFLLGFFYLRVIRISNWLIIFVLFSKLVIRSLDCTEYIRNYIPALHLIFWNNLRQLKLKAFQDLLVLWLWKQKREHMYHSQHFLSIVTCFSLFYDFSFFLKTSKC
jgi:hypothetical protein